MAVRKAFLVGINYKNTSSELKGCINDVESIKSMLTDHYEFNHILIMTDNTKIKPTRKNIIRGFRWLNSSNNVEEFNQKIKPLKVRSKLVFCFSGHGGQVPDINGDENDGYDETICPIDFEKNGMITDDLIRLILIDKLHRKTKLTGIVDACHSGTVFDLRWTLKPHRKNSFIIEKNNYKRTKGNVMLLSSCKDNQISIDLKNNGALIYSLIKILKHYDYHITHEKLLSEITNFIHSNKLSDQLPCMSFGRYINLHSRFRL
jgi:metacaspase-1